MLHKNSTIILSVISLNLLNSGILHPANFSFLLAGIISVSYLNRNPLAPLSVAIGYFISSVVLFGPSAFFINSIVALAYFLIAMASMKLGVTQLSGLVGSVIFFLVTNCNFLYAMPFYPNNFEGFITSYIMGIPFAIPTLLSNVFYLSLLQFVAVIYKNHFKKKNIINNDFVRDFSS